jgi:hypothetical protein
MYKVIGSTEIKYRSEFSKLCNARNARVAVEVGTDLGVFAAQFMQDFEGTDLLCIDDYAAYEWMKHDRTADMLMATIVLSQWHGKVRIVREKSADVAAALPRWITKSLCFAYIDADHEYNAVRKDLEAWWYALAPDGILAGHDYHPVTHPGVVQAVNEFAEIRGRTVRIVQGDAIHSWYIYKNEPDTLIEYLDL